MTISLGQLAKQFGCELRGDGNVIVERVASLATADATALSFLSGAAFKPQLAATRAAAVILRAADAAGCPTACLIHDNPYACYARIAAVLHPPEAIVAGIHASAVVAGTARVAASAQVAMHASIGERSSIGENSYVGPGCVVGNDCSIGANCRLIANVSVVQNVLMGDRCIVHPGAVLGADGFGNALTAEGWVKVPQVGSVRIGNDVEIGANTTVDRGALDDTVLEDGVRLDNLVHIAHNVKVGAHTAMAAMTGIAGSTTIGRRCMFAGQAGVVGHIEICDDVVVSGKGMISKSITEPGVYASNLPAEPVSRWNRMVARFRRLDKLIERVSKLENESK